MGTFSKDLITTAAKLEADALKLRDAAAILDVSSHGHSQHNGHGEPKRPAAPKQPAVQPFQGTRAEQLKAYLHGRNNHAATRQEILHESGIPAGTVASLLGFSKKFVKDKTDLWHIRGTAYLHQQAHGTPTPTQMQQVSHVAELQATG